VLDQEALRARADADEQFLAELLGTFVDTINDQVVLLLAAASRGDASAVVIHAHSIKGAAASVAAHALARAAADLETGARAGVIHGGDVEMLRSAWRETQCHPMIEPFVSGDQRTA
jgi:HPt (histidine-containing phosphotransfer) domain-containing protein